MRRTETRGEKEQERNGKRKERKKQNGDRRMNGRAARRKTGENPPRESKRKQTLRRPNRLRAGHPPDPSRAARIRKAGRRGDSKPGGSAVGERKKAEPAAVIQLLKAITNRFNTQNFARRAVPRRLATTKTGQAGRFGRTLPRSPFPARPEETRALELKTPRPPLSGALRAPKGKTTQEKNRCAVQTEPDRLGQPNPTNLRLRRLDEWKEEEKEGNGLKNPGGGGGRGGGKKRPGPVSTGPGPSEPRRAIDRAPSQPSQFEKRRMRPSRRPLARRRPGRSTRMSGARADLSLIHI